MTNCNIGTSLHRVKEYIRKKKVPAAISLLASIISIFVFLTGFENCPDALKKLWYDSAKDSEPSAKFYTVKLLLPARMSGAEVLVDSRPAVIVQQTPTVVTVQVERKTTGHQFTARKGEAVCTQPSQLIKNNNITIYPCR